MLLLQLRIKEDEVKYLPNIKNEKVGRNAPCPYGSGKEYKNCCGNK